MKGLSSKEPYDKQTYFSQYRDSFSKGEYNLKEQVYFPSGRSVRNYISGGVVVSSAITIDGAKTKNPDWPFLEGVVFEGGNKPLAIAASSVVNKAEDTTRREKLNEIYNQTCLNYVIVSDGNTISRFDF